MTPAIPLETVPQVIAIDPYLIAFVKANLITLGAVLAFLKGLAKITPGTTDDKIATLFFNLFNSLKTGRNQSPVEGEPSDEKSTE